MEVERTQKAEPEDVLTALMSLVLAAAAILFILYLPEIWAGLDALETWIRTIWR